MSQNLESALDQRTSLTLEKCDIGDQPKRDKIKLPARDDKNAYDDESTIKDRRWIAEKF